jgi:hypothetical protein
MATSLVKMVATPRLFTGVAIQILKNTMNRPIQRNHRNIFLTKGGGARRDRTADLYNAIVALSQLSYDPLVKGDLNSPVRFFQE